MDPMMFGGVITAFVLAVGVLGAVTRGPNVPGLCEWSGPFSCFPFWDSVASVSWPPTSCQTGCPFASPTL